AAEPPPGGEQVGWPAAPGSSKIGRGRRRDGIEERSRRARMRRGRSETIMAKLRLLKTGHGDLCLAEWDKDRPESVVEAASAFAENFTPGRLAFRLDGPGRTRPI